MGLAVSKVVSEDSGFGKKRGLAHGGGPVAVKQKTLTPNLRAEDCFGLDESQSRSTESTQSSPEIDMYPFKASRTQRASFGSSMGLGGQPKWFRRQSSTLKPATGNEVSLIEEPLPPSYLVFKNDSNKMGFAHSLRVFKSSTSGRTAPVPVRVRKTNP